MLTSLYTGMSGMFVNGLSLSVIADNISNMNTIGFKGNTVAFGDVLSQILTGSSSQVGRGVLVSRISPQFTQGSLAMTGNALDLAIYGDGFFMVKDGATRDYTRAGQFSLDKNGNIVNPDGLVLQGLLADQSGNITGTVGDLKIGTKMSAGKQTASATISVNLNSAAVAFPSDKPFTLDSNKDGVNNDPANFNYSTSTTVYDSQGGAHTVTLYFVKSGTNAWSVHYVQDDPANSGRLIDAGTQSLTFDTNGALVNDHSGTPVNFNFGTSVTTPQQITFNYGQGTGETPPGNGLDGTTQFGSDFTVKNLSQDGYAAGTLSNMTLSEDGIITGIFTNGQTRRIGQIALAKFVAPTGLAKLGRNLFGETYESGQPIVGSAGTSGLGSVLSGSLELSNVDLATEFVKMITAQRGFQANSRIITTTDELLQELVNLKR
jgi:flagellar hook protein FlgE